MTKTYKNWHGHVRPRPDGVKVRCGGPGLCGFCRAEQAILDRSTSQEALKSAAWDSAMQHFNERMDEANAAFLARPPCFMYGPDIAREMGGEG